MKRFLFLGLIVFFAAIAVEQTAAQTAPNDTSAFRIGKIAMAITKVDAMVAFYRNVFDINFNSFDVGEGLKIYSGKLAGINLVLAPNELANVKAEQSRMQFDIIVRDLEAIKAKVLANGGTVREEDKRGTQTIATVVDPDGNTIVLIQE